MDTYRRLEDVPALADSALTIGSFDGLHRGHLAVISDLVSLASANGIPAVVLTFDPHPQHVLAPAGSEKKKLVVTLEKKLSLLAAAGVDITVVLTFDHAFSRIPPLEFLERNVIGGFRPSHIVVGHDHRFGHLRQGTAAFLQEHARTHRYEVTVVEPVYGAGRAISSSRIRKLIAKGECEAAATMLGRLYEITGTVVAGAGRGQLLAYPTANLQPSEPQQLIPQVGVYVISAYLESQLVYGMCNVGFRPTFNGKSLIVEAHFFDPPDVNFGGRRLAFQFHHRIRDEVRFEGPEELRAQLDRDKESSLSWIAEHQGEKQIHASAH